MLKSLNFLDKIKKGFWINGLIKGKEVYFDEEYLHVKLEDNRIISTPIEWECIDYHLNIESMLEISLKKIA